MALFDFLQKKSEGPSKKTRGSSSRLNIHQVAPYGDVPGDGAIQLSFTLPVEASPEAKEAARKYVEKLGLKEVNVTHMEAMGKGFSYFVVYASARHAIDFTKVKVHKPKFELMNFDQVNKFARKNIRRRLVVLGATTGTDAHTVGLDAILNMKGYMGDPGLERYDCFKVINLRSQVDPKELIKQAVRRRADAILVSKIVTQRGKHLDELKALGKLMKKEKRLKSPLIKIVGGPRMSHAQATKLGFDAGYGPNTLPKEVASFLVQEYFRKMK